MNSSEIVVSVNVNTIFTPYNVAGNRILSKSSLFALKRSIGRAMIGAVFVLYLNVHFLEPFTWYQRAARNGEFFL